MRFLSSLRVMRWQLLDGAARRLRSSDAMLECGRSVPIMVSLVSWSLTVFAGQGHSKYRPRRKGHSPRTPSSLAVRESRYTRAVPRRADMSRAWKTLVDYITIHPKYNYINTPYLHSPPKNGAKSERSALRKHHRALHFSPLLNSTQILHQSKREGESRSFKVQRSEEAQLIIDYQMSMSTLDMSLMMTLTRTTAVQQCQRQRITRPPSQVRTHLVIRRPETTTGSSE